MLAPGRTPVAWARTPWREALDLPVANQIRHLKELMLSRSFFSRVPDQSLIVGSVGEGERHLRATRDSDKSYAFVYFPSQIEATIDATGYTKASWFDTRSGETKPAGTVEGKQAFTPPGEGDWVLVLDR
jgi:hypothetical protein